MTSAYAECVVCGDPIPRPEDAVLLADDKHDDDQPGRVEYRHRGCDPEDRARGRSTVVEF